MKNWTAEEVRRHADFVLDKDYQEASQMLTAFAERIEADESAVAIWQYRHEDDVQWSDCDELDADAWKQTGLHEVRKVFTHPPAQAAQVDALGTAGNRNPEHRYAGYKGRAFTGNTSDQKLAYEEGVRAAEPVAQGEVTKISRLIEMCGDAWQSMNAYTDRFDKGSKGVVSVDISAIDLVNWCQVIAMASRGLREVTHPHAVPDGWLLVPMEPTEEMIQACIDVWQSRLRLKAEEGRLLDGGNPHKSFRENYKAMLAAAPSPGESA